MKAWLLAWEQLWCPGRRQKTKGGVCRNGAQPQLKEDTSEFQKKSGKDSATGRRKVKVRRTTTGVADEAGTPGRTPRDLDSGSGSVPTWAGTLSKSLSSLGCVSIWCELLTD